MLSSYADPLPLSTCALVAADAPAEEAVGGEEGAEADQGCGPAGGGRQDGPSPVQHERRRVEVDEGKGHDHGEQPLDAGRVERHGVRQEALERKVETEGEARPHDDEGE